MRNEQEGPPGSSRALQEQADIIELFSRQVLRNPHSIALTFGAAELSYADLDKRSNQLARYLRAQGAGPEIVVALCMERSIELLVALLGILKAGSAYLPVDPEFPPERVRYVLQSGQARLVLTQPQFTAALAPLRNDFPVIVVDEPLLAGHDSGPLQTEISRDALAYVIFTSGSTGRPKGVAVTHAAIANRLLWMCSEYGFGPRDVFLQKTPYTFDVSVWELFCPLICGARLAIAVPGGHRDPEYLASLIDSQRVTNVHFVPSMLAVFMVGAGRRPLASLRHVFCSGEALSTSLAQEFASVQRACLHNLYGPTEAAVDVSYFRYCGEAARAGVPIGRAIWNIGLYVLNDYLEPVPRGAVGQLFIAGIGLARGYMGRGALTAQRFIADPIAGHGSRLYATGDRVRRLPDGNLEYLGRFDDQVKVAGHRIEPGEIEAVLCSHEAIQHAAVVAREDPSTGKRLIAYVIARTAVRPSAAELREHLRKHLPEFMVPAAWVFLESMPFTATGKVDRKALPAPAPMDGAKQISALPQGELERSIASVWMQILRIEHLGREDNFFELGGHSLLMVQMVERLRQMGIAGGLEIRNVFGRPTVAAVAVEIERVRTTGPVAVPNLIPADATTITPEMLSLVELNAAQIGWIVGQIPGGAPNIEDIYPLAPLQEGILFHHLLAQGGDPYILPSALVLDSRARLEGLIEAFQAAIDRHQVLRTAILWEDLPRPVQVVCRRAQLVVEEFELNPNREVCEQLRELITPARLRMDLRCAPLIRMRVARGADGKWYALLYIHHIITDHVALQVLIAELKEHIEGRSASLPPPVQFRGVVAQSLAVARSPETEKFFLQKLGDVSECTSPFGLANVQTNAAHIIEAIAPLETSLAWRIRQRARERRVSVATLFHAAFALMVARTSARDDVVFGTVLSGRLQGTLGADRALGMFINTLPMRVRLEGSTEQFIDRTHRELAELLGFEQAPLALAQRRSGMGGAGPLFSAVLNYRHSLLAGAGRPGADSRESGLEVLLAQERTNYPLLVLVDDLAPGFTVTTQTDQRIDPQRVTDYLLRGLESLLQALEAQPSTSVHELQVLPDLELAAVLHGFNARIGNYSAHHSIAEHFARQVARTPEAVALVYESQQLSYRDLNARANQLANHLRRRGVGPEALVGICLTRSVEMVVGVLAILKAGGAYVPLDPDHPPARLAFVADDARLRWIVTTADCLAVVPAHGRQIIALDADRGAIEANSADEPPEVPLQPLSLAYVIYTSGSTGEPKGVMVEQRSVIDRLCWIQEEYPLGVADAVLLKTPYGFDVSVFELFWPLCNGARLVIARPGGHRDPQYLLEVIQSQGVTTVHFVPSLLQVFVDAISGTPLRLALRRIMASGEELSAALASRCRQALPAVAIHNLYGPTEATIDVTYWPCAQEEALRVPIGRPVANARIYILDDRLRPVPLGVTGEIYIGGTGLARGYLHRPAATAERFIADPYSREPEARMYRTGDLGRWRADGNIEYLGRNDHQIKIRGFRVELGEIEARLQECAGVREAVVIAREDLEGQRRLVAYITPAGSPLSTTESLRLQLKGVLPDYMIPAAWVFLAELPLTPSGKVNRAALPAPDLNAVSNDRYAPPTTPVEAALAAIWAEVLQVERVGIHSDFFELGGDSLTAISVLSRVRTQGLRVTTRQFFENPTIAQLALVCRPTGVSTAEQGLVEGEVALTPVQHWFFEQDLEEAHHFNQALVLESAARLSPELLNAAVLHLMRHHDALRSRFARGPQGWRQWIGELPAAAPIECFDLTQLAGDEQSARFYAHTVDLQRSLDLSEGPLLRVGLFDLGVGRPQRLVWIIHHLVTDHVSWRVLREDFATLHGQLSRGEPAALRAKTNSLQEWSAHLLELSEVIADEEDYWLSLPWNEVEPLPLDDPAGDRRLGTSQTLDSVLSTEETREILDLASTGLHVPAGDLLLQCVARSLAAWSGKRTILLDIERHGREEQDEELDVSRTVGWFTSICPALLEVGRERSERSALRKLTEQMRAIPRRGLTYGIARYLARSPSMQSLPAAQVLFNYAGHAMQTDADEVFTAPVVRIAEERSPRGVRSHEIEINAVVLDKRLLLRWTYSPARLETATVAALAQECVARLRRLIEECRGAAAEYQSSQFPLVDLAQRDLDRALDSVLKT